ncbi:MAG: endopeptidase La, partial [Candidatus Electryoneaceae bacterium]|nr:endopeptidase La [Candidatus Electryoneaceae bacterium]
MPDELKLSDSLPLLLTEETVLFPGVPTQLKLESKEFSLLITDVLSTELKLLIVALKKPATDEEKRLADPYDVGCVVKISKMMRLPGGIIRINVRGVERVRINEITRPKGSYPTAKITLLRPIPPKNESAIKNIVDPLRKNFSEIIKYFQSLATLKPSFAQIDDPGNLADFIASNLGGELDDRQAILSTIDIEVRLQKVSEIVDKKLMSIKISQEIDSEVEEKSEKAREEYILREQYKVIRRKLGMDDDDADLQRLKERLEALKAPEQVKQTATKEIERMERMHPAMSEYNVSRTYIEWIFDLPWDESTVDMLDIARAREILDKDHYGLGDVKDRILEYLSVRKLKGGGQGSIICFIGPPGVGKTSIGKSIAEDMGRKFVRISLGGLHDESELRGHRRTYVGAMPGRIIQNLKRAGSSNPLFMLDEIDKLGRDYHGDPSSALLEILDPEQNFAFQDNYLELDFDLSNVMFITTANYIGDIPAPLLDRMEIIRLTGYIAPEKVEIAKRYLAPKQIKENGLSSDHMSISEDALEEIVLHYTREAGVRTLERMIGKVCRKVAVKVAGNGESEPDEITKENLNEYLGTAPFVRDIQIRSPKVGISNGLAWTEVGGVMLLIEVISMPGNGKVKITGQLGDVMRESA